MQTLKEITVADIIGEDESEDSRALVLAYVRQHPDGVSSQMVTNAIGVSDRRTRQILNQLCDIRELYKRDIPGVKGNIFYPNGKLVHKYLQESEELGSQIFRISFHEGKLKPKMQIQERSYALLDGETVEGSIWIDEKHIEEFIEFISDMYVKYQSFEYENDNKSRRRARR